MRWSRPNSRLDDRRQNVGDELHRPIAYRHAAIDAQARHGNPGIRRHRFDEIARLVADGLESGARDLRETALRGQPDQRPTRPRRPIGRSEPGKAGHEVEPLLRVGARGKPLSLCRRSDRAESVPRAAAPRLWPRSKRPISWRGQVYSPQQALDDPHIRAAGLLEEVTFPGIAATLPLAPTPIELSETPGTYCRRASLLGEHTGEILQSLGYDEAEIAALRAEKVI
jgi:hypothetical protein